MKITFSLLICLAATFFITICATDKSKNSNVAVGKSEAGTAEIKCGNYASAYPGAAGTVPGFRYRLVEKDHSFKILDQEGNLVGNILSFTTDAIQTVDQVKNAGNGVFCWRRTFRLREGQPKQTVRLIMDFQANYRSMFSVIPGISWNGNAEDPGNVYHGFGLGGEPWSFAFHRTLIPGGTYSESDHHSVGLFARVDDANIGLSCSLIPSKTTIHRLIIPEEEMPERVLQRERGLSPGRKNVLEMAPGDQRSVTAWLVINPVERPRLGYRHLLDVAWKHAYHPTFPKHTPEELWNLGLRFATESLWDDKVNKFQTAVMFDESKGWHRAGDFSIGWAGRNGELANALLTDYLKSGNHKMLTMGLDCLDAFASLVNTNLPKTDSLARFHGLSDNANILGDASTAFLAASLLIERCKVLRPCYREIGLGICDGALAIQKSDGQFSGPECKRGSIGASFIAPLLSAYEMTKEPKYLKGARLALSYYMDIFYRNGFLWGGALDTKSIDKETIAPMLEGAVRLLMLTRDREYLKIAEDAAYYLAAWQFAQSIPNVPGSLMDAVGYDTFGGTSVATVHMCADPYALRCVPWLIRLADLSGQPLWEQRAIAIWNNASQGISEGSLIVQGISSPRPAGSQDETVNYTDWGYDFAAQGMDRLKPRGAGQCWMTAWPTSMRLTILSDPELWKRIAAWPAMKPSNNILSTETACK